MKHKKMWDLDAVWYNSGKENFLGSSSHATMIEAGGWDLQSNFFGL
jgi:hypothetical protein